MTNLNPRLSERGREIPDPRPLFRQVDIKPVDPQKTGMQATFLRMMNAWNRETLPTENEIDENDFSARDEDDDILDRSTPYQDATSVADEALTTHKTLADHYASQPSKKPETETSKKVKVKGDKSPKTDVK